MKNFNFFYLIVCYVLGFSFSFAQDLSIKVPLDKRIGEATLIIEGKITGQYAAWNAAHTLIHTYSTVEVYKLFKGDLPATVIIQTLGGQIQNDLLIAEPELQLTTGDAGIFLLHSQKDQLIPVAASQGLIKYDPVSSKLSDGFDLYTNREAVYQLIRQSTDRHYSELKPFPSAYKDHHRSLAAPVISGMSPNPISAGTFDTLTISGNNFGSTYTGSANVQFRNANDGGSSYISTPANHIISWSNTQIQVLVPYNAGTGTISVTNSGNESGVSGSPLTILFSQINIVNSGIYYEPNLVSKNGTGGYRLSYSTSTANNGISFASHTNAKARFESALETWRCNTGFNVLVTGTSAVAEPASDQVFLVTFDNDAAPLPSGVLGRAYSFYSGCGTPLKWFVNDIDLVFRRDGSGITWYFGANAAQQPQNTADFETIALHELGHNHQLGHVISSGAIMHYTVTLGSNNRSLNPSQDIAGGEYVMSHSTAFNSCGQTGMSAYSCAIAPVAAFSGNPASGCSTPLTVEFTDESTFEPTAWQWSFPGGTPSSSAQQNPVITYNNPGNYSVTLKVSNASGSDSLTKVNYIRIAFANAGPDVTICKGDTTQLFASGGTSYSWSPDSGLSDTSIANPKASPDVTTTYVVTVKTNDCTNTDTVTVQVIPELVLTFTTDSVSCYGNEDGSATVNPSGGSGNYGYAWSNGDTTATADSLSGGTYQVTVTDKQNGCTTEGEVNLFEPDSLDVSAANDSTFGCDGMLTAQVNGGTPGYSFLWTTGETTQTIDSLCPGAYLCLVTDANGCMDSAIAIVFPLTGISNKDKAAFRIYPNPSSGHVVLEGFAGTPGVLEIRLYNLLGEQLLTWEKQVTGVWKEQADLSHLPAGAYMLIIKDGTQQHILRLITKKD